MNRPRSKHLLARSSTSFSPVSHSPSFLLRTFRPHLFTKWLTIMSNNVELSRPFNGPSKLISLLILNLFFSSLIFILFIFWQRRECGRIDRAVRWMDRITTTRWSTLQLDPRPPRKKERDDTRYQKTLLANPYKPHCVDVIEDNQKQNIENKKKNRNKRWRRLSANLLLLHRPLHRLLRGPIPTRNLNSTWKRPT